MGQSGGRQFCHTFAGSSVTSANGDFCHIYAIYEHEHVRTPNGWRISKSKMTPSFQEGNPKLLDATFALATKS
jgi:hypothetical protein